MRVNNQRAAVFHSREQCADNSDAFPCIYILVKVIVFAWALWVKLDRQMQESWQLNAEVVRGSVFKDGLFTDTKWIFGPKNFITASQWHLPAGAEHNSSLTVGAAEIFLVNAGNSRRRQSVSQSWWRAWAWIDLLVAEDVLAADDAGPHLLAHL